MTPRRTALAAAAVAAVGAVGAAGCGGDRNDAAAGTDSASEPAVAVDDPLDSGVGVRATGCGLTAVFGTGVAVGAPGRVATVAHTVAGAEDVTVIDRDGKEFGAEVIVFDPDADLALLAVDDLRAPALPVGTTRTGDASTLRWRPDQGVERLDAEITRRLLITIEDIYVEREVQRTGLELAADIEIGDSGGPVLDTDGAVVGIVYANSKSRPNVGFATDSTELTDLLTTGTEVPAGSGADTGRCR